MSKEDKKEMDFIEETVLKKRKNNEEWAVKRRERLRAKMQRNDLSAKLAIRRPEQFVKEYRDKELDLVRMKNRLKGPRSSRSNFNSKLLFVIRIHGSQGMHPKSRRILNNLGLKNIFEGVFVKASESMHKILLAVEPFVTYGHPNTESVRRLVYKKGCGNKNEERIPLTDNTFVEEELGEHGIICLEDIVHEIASVGKQFNKVTKFLWPFRLMGPNESTHYLKKAFRHGGDTGNRGVDINAFIDKLN